MNKTRQNKIFWHRISLAISVLRLVNRENESFATKSPVETEKDPDIASIRSEFKSHYSRMIWDIMSHYEVLRNVTRLALLDAERCGFDSSSSIDTKEDYNRLSTIGNFEKLQKTRLLQHTYHVVWIASTLKEQAGNNMAALLLIALFHDFGKNGAIKQQSTTSKYTNHEEISANYARTAMRACGDFDPSFIDILCTIISSHHTPEKSGGALYDLLNHADMSARMLENGTISPRGIPQNR